MEKAKKGGHGIYSAKITKLILGVSLSQSAKHHGHGQSHQSLVVLKLSAEMTHRGGGTKATVVVILVVMMLTVKGNPLPLSEEEGDCLVEDSIDVEGQDLPVLLLAYVSISNSVEMGFFFPGLNREMERDVVSINSTGATHREVRDNKGPFTDIRLPRLIPEGWNIFLVDASGKNVTVTLVQGEDRLTLFTLPSLRDEVHSMQARGKVARCSTVTPTWKVNPGEAAVVVLQPVGDGTHNQWLEVGSRRWGTDAPHFDIRFTPSSRLNVSDNSTIRITSSVRGEHVHYRLFKEAKIGGGEDGNEEVTSGSVSSNTTSLRVEVGGWHGGDDDSTATILVRLHLSPPNTKSIDNSASSSSPDYRIPFYVMLGLVVLGVLLVLVWLVRNDVKRGNGVLASCFKGCKTKGEGRDSTGHTEAEGQEGNSIVHMNGAYRGVGSKEDINGHGPSCERPLLPNSNGTPTQRDPRCYHDYGKVDCPGDDDTRTLDTNTLYSVKTSNMNGS